MSGLDLCNRAPIDIGPIVAPIVRAQLAHADASECLESLTAIGWNAARAPVRDRLDAFPERHCNGCGAVRLRNGLVEHGFVTHSRMVHVACSDSQQNVWGAVHSPFVNAAWHLVEAELAHRKKGLQWLATKLECTIQRVQNWTTRGIPVSAYPEVAAAFGESIDWVAGLAPPRRKIADETDELSPSEWGHLKEYRDMAVDDRRAIDEETRMRAEKMRTLRREVMADLGYAEAKPEAGNAIPLAPRVGAKPIEGDRLKGGGLASHLGKAKTVVVKRKVR